MALAGCGKHDQEYYYINSEKAKQKVQDCNAEAEKAWMSGDEKAARAPKHDPECSVARSALMQIEDEEYEQKRAAEKVARKAKIEKQNQAVQAKYGSQGWRAYLATFSNSLCGSIHFSLEEDSECAAMEKLLQTKLEEGRKELAKTPYQQLMAQKKQYCATDRREYSACSIWREVTQKQEKEIVRQYVKDYEAFKKVYNECVYRYNAVPTNQPRLAEKQDEILNAYPCKQAIKAAEDLHLILLDLENKKMD